MNRRTFLEMAAVFATAAPTVSVAAERDAAKEGYSPGRIPNYYSLLLPGEREALAEEVTLTSLDARSAGVKIDSMHKAMQPGEVFNGWQLLLITRMNGSATAVFEKHVTHQGVIVFVTESEGVILRIGTRVGKLSNIGPRPINVPKGGVKFVRQVPYVPGPDAVGNYILNSSEDPCYENIAALGAEYIGYTLVANEQAGPLRSLFLESDGKSRQPGSKPQDGGSWAPDLSGPLFDPSHFFPGETPSLFEYLPGYSKRTLLGGFLPVADIGVWNPHTRAGYEVMVLLPPGTDSQPMARIRVQMPPEMTGTGVDSASTDRYWNASPHQFFAELAGIGNYWNHFFEDNMKVDIPDPWLLDAARAGITLARCSYRGLEPTYQIGEGAYTKIPERSHALFPVAHYEFVWAHQLWNLSAGADEYSNYYLDKYILPNGDFLYNTQDQVEAPSNTGIFLWNSARSYDYGGDVRSLQKRLPVLRSMIGYVLNRYQFSKAQFPPEDRRHGLIWGSPEADLGEPNNDFPNSHPYYYQNAVWTWRGLREHARCLARVAEEHKLSDLAEEAKDVQSIADEMRPLIERSLRATIAAGTAEMRKAGIAPFSPDDVRRKPEQLSSYENHRFMMDWFTADWGDPALDQGHFRHREIAGLQIFGLGTNGPVCRISNFMEHGTLAGRIRQDDYRPFLLSLYGLVCYAADSGNRYSPEDAYLPGSYPGDGNPYQWSAVVNSVLQPTMGLRWLLCYEESDRDLCHLQKAVPKHWFAKGEGIKVERCPTRFGHIDWQTRSNSAGGWDVTIDLKTAFTAEIAVHIHPPDGRALRSSTVGRVERNAVILDRSLFNAPGQIKFQAS